MLWHHNSIVFIVVVDEQKSRGVTGQRQHAGLLVKVVFSNYDFTQIDR